MNPIMILDPITGTFAVRTPDGGLVEGLEREAAGALYAKLWV